MREYLESDPVGRHMQAQYRLKVLTLCLDRSSRDLPVVFELTAANGDAHVNQVALLVCPSERVGLPFRLDDRGPDEASFSLPSDIQAALAAAVQQSHPTDAPLWVKFTSPAGMLPIVPWERLLQPLVRVPVLRLPYHQLPTLRRSHNLDCVICFSSPTSADRATTDALIARFIDQVPADLLAYAKLHLFGDLNVQTQLHELKSRFGREFDIRIYEPPEGNSRPRGTLPPGATRIENPWLIWMRDAIGHRKVDVMHFLAHSFLAGEEGAMALAESPGRSDRRWEARYVAAVELAEFLNQSGAWCVGFSSPPDNPSLAGLRLLQDQIARLRPGPCLLHDMAQPEGEGALSDAYRFLVDPDSHRPLATPAIAIYSHPLHSLASAASDDVSVEVLNRVTLLSRIGEDQIERDDHGWLTSAQRVLEQSATRLCDTSSAEEEDSLEGRRSALEFVADSLAKHATQSVAPASPNEIEAGSPLETNPTGEHDG